MDPEDFELFMPALRLDYKAATCDEVESVLSAGVSKLENKLGSALAPQVVQAPASSDPDSKASVHHAKAQRGGASAHSG